MFGLGLVGLHIGFIVGRACTVYRVLVEFRACASRMRSTANLYKHMGPEPKFVGKLFITEELQIMRTVPSGHMCNPVISRDATGNFLQRLSPLSSLQAGP